MSPEQLQALEVRVSQLALEEEERAQHEAPGTHVGQPASSTAAVMLCSNACMQLARAALAHPLPHCCTACRWDGDAA